MDYGMIHKKKLIKNKNCSDKLSDRQGYYSFSNLPRQHFSFYANYRHILKKNQTIYNDKNTAKILHFSNENEKY